MAKMTTRGPTKRFLISEMDRSVKRMLKLIEDEGDSFAKKAEIYIQKRPELVSQVEDFYRMFKSLAERYDDATCELRRTLPPDSRSQNCGMTEICSEPPSAITSPEHKVTRRLSVNSFAFLDAVGNKDNETPYDSGSDLDDSFYNNYSGSSNYGNYRRLRRKITELESELRKLQIEQEVNGSNNQIADYEEELRIAKEKIQSSEEEICCLKAKLETYESLQYGDTFLDDSESRVNEVEEDFEKLTQEGDPDDTNVDDLMDEADAETEDEIEQLATERDEFVMKLSELEEEISLKDDQLVELNNQLDELNNQLKKLQLECDKSMKSIEELEKVIEKQRVMIEEGNEEKQQTERQLRISLEHYRNAYQMLRKGLMEQKNPVMVE